MTPHAFVLPEGEYHTALDVTEEILQSLNNADPPSEIEITVDDDWNVTLNSQREGLMITLSTARALGWMTENNTRQRRFTFPPAINVTNSFYVLLTSDASLSEYPENKAADFKMQLPRQLHLSEDWEVAMIRVPSTCFPI